MRQIRIVGISGATYPVDVYIADVNGNYQTYLGTITSGDQPPPDVNYTTQIPSIFNTAPAIMLLMIGANGCRVFKILDCTFGCFFDIVIQVADCNFTLNIQPDSCDFGILSSSPDCGFGLRFSSPSC